MTILLTVLCTILAIIVIAGVLVCVLAPFRISFKREAGIQYDLEFGFYMRDCWISVDWFSVTKLYLDNNDGIYHADLLFTFFRGSDRQIKKVNDRYKRDEEEKAELKYGYDW